METFFKQLCAREKQFKVLVVGDLILDVYLKGRSTRLCPEAAAPVLEIATCEQALGGAGNTAYNLASMGAIVTCMGVTGNDEGALDICGLMARQQINAAVIKAPDRGTMVKTRLVAGTQLLTRYDSGTETAVSAAVEQRLIALLESCYGQYDAVVLADYQKGLFTPRVIAALESLRRLHDSFLAVDAKDLRLFASLRPSVAKPNSLEVSQLLHLQFGAGKRTEALQDAGKDLYALTGAAVTTVTLDDEGALVFIKDQLAAHTTAHKVRHPQVSGAGDTYISTYTLASLYCADPVSAATIAGMAAGIAITKDTTASCTSAELMAASAVQGKFVEDIATLAMLGTLYRNAGSRIVFTNGCFDILHSGHVNYLRNARELGDVLIVGINTDESIRRLKGEDRPVNTLAERMEVLAGLAAVTHIIPFGQLTDDTPCDLITALRPDIFVKGGDYTLETLPEARLVEQLGGEVQLLPLVKGRSTTAIIREISSRQLSPASYKTGV